MRRSTSWLLLLCLAGWSLGTFSGCGGGAARVPATGGTPAGDGSVFGDYQGPVGALRLHVVWPAGRTIPDGARTVDVEITGEGLQAARTAQITRPESETVVDRLPVGQKGVAASAKDENGQVLAFGFSTVVVRSNATSDAVVELSPLDEAGVAQARAMVQNVRDAGVALGATFADEAASAALVTEADLMPTYTTTLQRLSLLSALSEVTSLEPATYRAVFQAYGSYYGWYWGWLEFERTGDAPDANTWVVTGPETNAYGEGWTTRFARGGGGNNLALQDYSFQVSSSKDARLDYHGTFSVEANEAQQVTKITANGSFKDQFLPGELAVNGVLTGQPGETTDTTQAYSQMAFTGSINGPKFQAALQATVTGNVLVDRPGRLSGHVDQVEIQALQVKTVGVENPMTATLSGVVELANLDGHTLPRKGRLNVAYQSNSCSQEGLLEFDWANPQAHLTDVPVVTATLSGRVAARNRPIFTGRVTLNSTQPPDYTVGIDLTRGSSFLRGQLAGKAAVAGDGGLETSEWSLELQNENSLKVQFGAGSGVGTILSAGGSKVADILEDPDLHLTVVRYIDGTVEALAGNAPDWETAPITGEVRATVKDSQGAPIRNAWVYTTSGSGWTDDTGVAVFLVLPGPQRVWVSTTGYFAAAIQEVDVPPRGSVDVAFQLVGVNTIQRVEGQVVDAQNQQPLARALVFWQWRGYYGGGLGSPLLDSGILTDANGRFSLSVYGSVGQRSDLVVGAVAAGYASVAVPVQANLTIGLSPRAPSPTDVTVTGTIRDATTGQAVGDALAFVSATSWGGATGGTGAAMAFSGADGQYRAVLPAADRLDVQGYFSASGYYPSTHWIGTAGPGGALIRDVLLQHVYVPDTTPPSITNPTVTPSQLPSSGGVVTIEATVTDNTAVGWVRANVVGPSFNATLALFQAGGSLYRGKVSLPPNTETSPRTYSVAVTAGDAQWNATGSVPAGTVTVAGAVPHGQGSISGGD